MRRLLYCLLGSTLLHAALLWLPPPMSAGGAGGNPLQPLRVRLLSAPAPDTAARKRVPGPSERPARTRKAPPADAVKPAPAPKRRPAATPVRTRVATARRPAEEKVQGTSPPKQPAPEQRQQTRMEPARSTKSSTEAEPEEEVRAASAPSRAPELRNESGGDAPREALPARKTASKAPPGTGAATGFTSARYARTVKPRYPGKARRGGWEGTTVLKVLVDAGGAPDRVAVHRTSGFDVLDAAAVKAVHRWSFHPARRGGKSVSSWVRVPIVFKLKEDNRLHGKGRSP